MLKLFSAFIIVFLLLLGAAAWFNAKHLGWLDDVVVDNQAYLMQWQQEVNALSLTHPSILHWMPEDCLCSFFSLNHALDISVTAASASFNIYQLNTTYEGLGDSVYSDSLPLLTGSTIVMTNAEGQIAYVGAYSDGLRCNDGNSMVSRFTDSPDLLPVQPIVGTNVRTCLC